MILSLNPGFDPARHPAPVIGPEARADARAVLDLLPAGEATPLHDMPDLAADLGIGRLWLKDDSVRRGPGAVKSLGAPVGLAHALAAKHDLPMAEIAAGRHAKAIAAERAVAATDGNHGLALSFAARRMGCGARIHIGNSADRRRVAAIERLGAEIVRHPGTYDDAIAAAARDAETSGVLISDTDWSGEDPVTLRIMAGYMRIVLENAAHWAAHPPSHAFLPAGVGGLAAAMTEALFEICPQPPKIILVEPERADGLRQSLLAGAPAPPQGDMTSIMAGLACGVPSRPAFDILKPCAFAAMTVPDTMIDTVRDRLAAAEPPVLAGHTGAAAGLGLLCAARDPETCAQLNLGADSRVLILVCEPPEPRFLDLP